MNRAALIAILGDLDGARISPGSVVREAAAAMPDEDSAALVQLTDGRFAFVHAQPETHGVGAVISNDLARCEQAATRARYRGQPSDVAARLGVAPRPGNGGPR